MRPPSCSLARGPLLLTVLVLPWLGGTRAQDTCAPPERLTYAEPKEDISTMKDFPVGTTVSYTCRPGYVRILEKQLSRTCGKDLEWSPKEQFCTEMKCSHPGDLENGAVTVTDLKFGSKATFSCGAGFRLVGTSEATCIIVDKGVAWDRDLPFCQKIPCKPPPDIANGHHTEAAEYLYQTSVTYTCNDVPRGSDPFSLIGSATIVCTFNQDTLDGVWSGPPPECKVVKCTAPRVENGFRRSGLGFSFTYNDSVVFECNPGYFMVGSNVVTCTKDSTWFPPTPTCREVTESGCDAPKVTHGVVTPEKSVYATGESVQIRCTAPCTFPGGAEEMTATCQGQNTWSPLQDCACEAEGSGSTPHIHKGRVVDGQKPSYTVGDFITIECYAGYTLHGSARIQYIGGNQWAPEVPTCHLSAYITAIICVIVAIVVILAAFWIYKKFFSQNGKRDSTSCTAEYKSCKA
ncbi:membrane cofactor protein-like isoform X2 [Pogoniulus pusillus]|uniref:membrane cofactor protein-like isoform X2 n=1 Tax=Pogoniulus pusillus TaxID=488313 RepID=UPI0030B9332F